MINLLLENISYDLRNTLYSVFGYVMYFVFAVMLLLFAKRYQISKKQTVCLWISFAVAYFWCTALTSMLGNLTDGIIPRANMGVAFLPFCMTIAAIAYATDFSVSLYMDMCLPVFISGRAVTIVGCIFTGCCHGFPAEWGIYSFRTGGNVVPTVILDSVLSWIIAAYLMYTAKKISFCGNGIVSAKGLVLFGLLRLVIDILRDNKKLLFMLTMEGFCGIIYILLGLTLLHKIKENPRRNKQPNLQIT